MLTHDTSQKLKWCFRTVETRKRYDYNRSHVRSKSFATEQWQSAVSQVQSSQRWVELNQRSVPHQHNNVRSFSRPSLPAHAKFNRPRHPKPRVLARRDFYFSSARIVIVTHRSANEEESAGRLSSPGFPGLLFDAKFQFWLFFRDGWRQKFFSQYLSFWRQLGHAIKLVSPLFKYLLKSVIRIF